TGRAHDAPDAAELGHVLAEDLAGLEVVDVVVERAPCIGRLQRAIGPLRRAEPAAGDAGTRARARLDEVRRPGLGAGTAARAAPVRVTRESIEHEAAPVEQDPSERGALDDDGRTRRARGA